MVTEGTLARAKAGDEQAFGELTDPYRAELLRHCYQILGSVADAEDMVQETLLAAWRGLASFEGRSSPRTWLHRIAANGCLNALRDRSRRPREVPLMPEPPQPTDPVWAEPYPDVLLDGLPDTAPGPEARYDTKESIELAFITALQHLPPRQRRTSPGAAASSSLAPYLRSGSVMPVSDARWSGPHWLRHRPRPERTGPAVLFQRGWCHNE